MKPKHAVRLFPLLAGSISIAAMLAAPSAHAATLYWDGATANWSTLTAWSTASGATTPNATSIPDSADDLIFNITTANTAGSNISLAGNDRAARSLTFNTSGATNFRAGGTPSVAVDLTVGTGGITLNSGAVTIGQTPTTYGTITTVLSASQSWATNGGGLLTVVGPVTLGSRTLTLSGTGSGGITISNAIGGTGAVILDKSGTGAVTLSGANNYSGGFTLKAGAINISAGAYDGFGSGTTTINSTAGSGFVLPTSSAAVIANDMEWLTTLRAQRTGTSGTGLVTFDGDITLKGNSGITVSSSTHAVAAVFNGAIGEDVAGRTFTTSGSTAAGNAVTFNGQNTFTGGITNSTNGSVTIGGSGYLGGGNYSATIAMGSGTLFYSSSANQTLGGAISGGSGKLTKDTSTTSTLTLTAANTYTGATTINDGILQLGNGGTTGTIQGSTSVVIGTGAEFAINRSNAATQGATSVLGNNAVISGAGSVRIMGGTGGTGSVGMNQANTYSGGTILDAGTLIFGSNGNGTSTGPIGTGGLTINGGTIDNNSGTARTVLTSNAITANANFAFGGTGDLTLSGTVDLAGSTRTLTTNGTAALTLNGIVSNGGLTKAGTGKLVLGGANDYTGLTTVTDGTLALGSTGSISSSSGVNLSASTSKFNVTTANFTLGATQTLGGIGTVENTGQVFTANGILAPGNSPGTLTVDGGTFALGVGGDYNFQILDAAGPAGTGYDTVNLVNGATLDLSSLTASSYTINLLSLLSTGPDVSGNASNFNNTLSYSWTLFSTAASLFSSFNANDFAINAAGFSNALGGGYFSVGLADSDTDLVLNFTPVPEPRAALLGGVGMLLMLRRRRP
jgi:autotransporter-associated beta strand protein